LFKTDKKQVLDHTEVQWIRVFSGMRELDSIVFMCVFLWFILSIFLIVCLSVTIKWLAMKTASEMTYTVSGGALNSTQSNPLTVFHLWILFMPGRFCFYVLLLSVYEVIYGTI